MNRFTLAIASAGLAFAGESQWRRDSVTLQLKWVTQAQFAGYYVAKDKGFYAEEDLDVEIIRAVRTSLRRKSSPAVART